VQNTLKEKKGFYEPRALPLVPCPCYPVNILSKKKGFLVPCTLILVHFSKNSSLFEPPGNQVVSFRKCSYSTGWRQPPCFYSSLFTTSFTFAISGPISRSAFIDQFTPFSVGFVLITIGVIFVSLVKSCPVLLSLGTSMILGVVCILFSPGFRILCKVLS
jgi:hypothetical protein